MPPSTRLQTPLVFVLYGLMAVAAASQQVPDDAADVRPLAVGDRHQQLPVSSVFLVDGDGIVRFRYVNPDYRERLSAEALLEAAGVE